MYERARPGYPDEAVAWMVERLRIRPDSTVLDLAAGTGKLTRQLVAVCGRVIAVEPVAEMRVELIKVVPEAEVLDGTAEAIPLRDGSVDAVTCAQAFHWFRMDEALPEIHRVLRPGGGLAALWNVRDLTDPLQARLEQILQRHDAAFRPVADWSPDVLERSDAFGRVDHRTWLHEQPLVVATALDRVASTSFVATKPPVERAALLGDVAALLAGEGEPIAFRYVTEVFVSDAL